MAVKDHPCKDGLTPECMRVYPSWARKMFAYRLLLTLCPHEITKRLPKLKNLLPLLHPPDWPPETPWAPGYEVDPGGFFPPDWTPEDELPAEIIIDTGAVFPADWRPGDPLPAGITIDPGTIFPPGWTAGDPLPKGVSAGVSQRPAVFGSGAIPPYYIQIWEPGPVHRISDTTPDIWEPWGSTICENHDWTVENAYFPIGGSSYYFYDVYDCETGPDLSLSGGNLNYDFTNPATNNLGRNEHKVECLIYLEYPETAGLIGKTKVKINFPVAGMSGTPAYEYLNPIIYVSIVFIRANGSSGTKALFLYNRLNPSLGPGVHEELLYLGEAVRITRASIRTRTYKNNTAVWGCDYITFI